MTKHNLLAVTRAPWMSTANPGCTAALWITYVLYLRLCLCVRECAGAYFAFCRVRNYMYRAVLVQYAAVSHF